MTYDETHYRPGNLMGARPDPPPPAAETEPDRYRCEITPGLSVVTDASGLVLIETDLAVRRHPIRDVAVAVVALETARDVSGGGPSEGSPLQRATDALLTLAERVYDGGAGFAT